MIYLASILFLLCPVLSMPIVLIGLFMEKKHKRFYIFLISIMIGIVCYYIVPNSSMDLFRYYEFLDQIRYSSISEALIGISNSTEIFTNLFFYMIAILHNNSFLVFFTAIIYYNILFYIIMDYSNLKQLSNIQMNLIILYSFTTIWIIPTILGVRYGLAMITFLFAFYLDVVKDKKGVIYKLLYIIPIFIHTSSAIFLLVRFVLAIRSKKIKVFAIIGIILLAVSPNIILSLVNYLPSLGILEPISVGIKNYLIDGNEIFENLTLLKIGLALGIIIFMFWIRKYMVEEKEKKIYQYICTIIIMMIVFIYSPTLCIRLVDFINLLFILILIDCFNKKELKLKKANVLFLYFCVILIFSLRTQVIYFKQPEGYSDLFPDKIGNNIYTIFTEKEKDR